MALTFADYLTWNESEHIELIDGEAVKYCGNSPTSWRAKSAAAPFAVRLFEKEENS